MSNTRKGAQVVGLLAVVACADLASLVGSVDDSSDECSRCGHPRGEHDEGECRGGENLRCSCECFEDPDEEE